VTTFIDFRYSRTLASAMFAGMEPEEREIAFAGDRDNYLAVEVRGGPAAGVLARFRSSRGDIAAMLVAEAGGGCVLARGDGTAVVALPAGAGLAGESRVVTLRIGPAVAGLREGDRVVEAAAGLLPADGSPLAYGDEDASRLRVMGRGTGRAMAWAELAYRRRAPTGLHVGIAMDWHHLRAGIPWFGTMTAEQWVAAGDFRLGMRSYAYDDVEARTTDFARLFATPGEADVVAHLSPPLYATPREGIPNLGFFVIEARNFPRELVRRCNRMDAICVPSRFAGDAARDAGVTVPIHLVPHGVDLDYFRPVARREPLPRGRGFNFLAVCTHTERKNAKHIVRAFLEEFRAHEDVALFLLLRPEYHVSPRNAALEFTDWERRYDRDSAPALVTTDYVSRERLRDLYANADAYVMPSNEGFGLTLLEAMACGTPVIALDHGGVTDFVTHGNGWLVPPGRGFVARDVDTLPVVGDRYRAPDLGKLRAAMRAVLERPDEARRRAERARRDCEERYSWARVSADLARAVEATHALGAGRTPPPAAARSSLAWLLGIVDDEPCRADLRRLARAVEGSTTPAVALFTRYAQASDVMLARRLGFLVYRWDATPANARRIAGSLLGPGWVALLRSGERFEGDVAAVEAFLAELPDDVAAVALDGEGAREEPRVMRVGRVTEPRRTVAGPAWRIAGAPA
jgi:glycosyltransferase involved in cell wall biosynthesis